MRKLVIFLYFWIMGTISLHLGDLFAIIMLLAPFIFLYTLAEQLDEETL